MVYQVNVSSNRTGGLTNTHHVKLSKSGTVVGLVLCDGEGKPDPFQIQPNPNPRTPLRISQGETDYGDINPHLTAYAQKDFSAGRGYDEFEIEKSGYHDGFGINTTIPGKVYSGGFYSYSKGVRNWLGLWPHAADLSNGFFSNGDIKGDRIYYDYEAGSSIKYWAYKVTTGTSGWTAAYLEAIVLPPVGGSVTLELRSDWAGKPNTILASATVTLDDFDEGEKAYRDGYGTVGIIYKHVRKSITPVALSATTSYWIVVNLSSAPQGQTSARALITSCATDALCATSDTGGAYTYWETGAGEAPFCRVTDADDPIQAYFQNYKGAFYTAVNYLDLATTPKIMVNGYHGVPITTGTTASNIAVSGTPFVADELIGSICYIWDGTGANSKRPYRVIEDNTDNDLIFTSDPWDFTPDTSTVFSVVAADKWVEIAGSGWGTSNQISDMKEASGTLYMAMGPNVDIKMLSVYNNSGTWTSVWDSVTGYKADLLQTITEGGQTYLWKAERVASEIAAAIAPDNMGGSSNEPNYVYDADTNPYAVEEFDVGNLMYRINSLCVYGDYPHLWVLKEDKPIEVVNNDPYEFRLGQISASWDFRNGMASCHHDNFIYWSFKESLERWHQSGSMKHMGPDIIGNAGMPWDRRGHFVKLVGWQNLLIGAYDGGSKNYSTILAWNGRGWHELFRSPWKGARILGLGVEGTPGNHFDRLHFSCGGDLMYLPLTDNPAVDIISENTDNPDYVHAWGFYPFTWNSYIETGWIYYTLKEQDKYWDSLEGVLDDFIQDATDIQLCFKVDDDSSWTKISNFWDGIRAASAQFSSTNDTVAKRIKFKLVLYNYNNKDVGRILGFVTNLALNLDQKHLIRLQFRVRDNDVDLQDHPDTYMEGIDKITTLRTMADGKTPVLMNTFDPTMDNIYGFIDYPSIRVRNVIQDEGLITRVCQLFIREI